MCVWMKYPSEEDGIRLVFVPQLQYLQEYSF